MSLKTRWRHGRLALANLPGLLVSGRKRALLGQMRRYSQQLPHIMQRPLPDALTQVTPNSTSPSDLNADEVRQLADLTALLDRRSPLGLCLRRSLLRYHFMRRDGHPISILFGAKFKAAEGQQRDVTGHAWTTLNGQPYHEVAEDWEGFTVMFEWPKQNDD